LFSEKSKGDSDGASAYLDLLKWKIEEEPEMLRDVLPNMLKVAEHISINQLYYDADEDIYECFDKRYKVIKTLLE